MRNSRISSPGTPRLRWVLGLAIACLVQVMAGGDLTVVGDPGPDQRGRASNLVCGLAASGGGHSLACIRGRTMSIIP